MNGYPSTIAALKRAGLKITDPVNAPIAIFADPQVYAAAPAAMSAAGFADLLSKYTSGADWRLARQLEGSYYCERPSKLSAMAAEEAVGVVDAIRAGEPAAIVTLMEASVLSGLAMAIAGSSAPSSGAEHLISHYWDMTAPATGGRRFHGTQVGIGVLIVAALYEMLREIEPRQIQPEVIAEGGPMPEDVQEAIEAHFGDVCEPVIEQSLAKMLTPKGMRQRASQIRDTWPFIKQEILSTVPTRNHLADLLERSGAPTTAGQLGVARQQVIDALAWSRHIRSRYTAFDFAHDIGVFTEKHRSEILERSGVLRDV
jgi:glycerol-1-phosphate dehydrogenase [NAD(P)+]